jgi:hypothetical protein
MTYTITTTRRQVSLREWFLWMALMAVLASFWWRAYYFAIYYGFVFAVPVAALASFLLGRRFGFSAGAFSRWPILFSLAVVSWLALVLLCLAALWTRHRWNYIWHDPIIPRPFPYPDVWLLQLHAWYDVQYPAPPGYLKIHGEHARVLMTINGVAFVCIVLHGVLLGAIGRVLWLVEGPVAGLAMLWTRFTCELRAALRFRHS